MSESRKNNIAQARLSQSSFLSDINQKQQTKPVSQLSDRLATLSSMLPVQIAAGGDHTLFLNGDGQVYSCGANHWGQLGVSEGPSTRFYHKREFMHVKFPINVSIRHVAAGQNHSLFLDDHGRVYGCGSNLFGEAGVGDVDYAETPQLLTNFPAGTEVIQLAAGLYRSFFLTRDGYIYCCGSDKFGELGLYDGRNHDAPIRLTGFPIDAKIKKIASGVNHTLFLTDDGRVYGCGSNYHGQLGLGRRERCPPMQLIEFPSGIKICDIAANGGHSLFLSDKGNVYGCGDNYYGQLGIGGPEYRHTPVQLTNFPAGTEIIQLVAGYDHSFFLTKDGYVYGCGDNYWGQLGLGPDVEKQRTPKRLIAYSETQDIKFNNIATARVHSLFLTDDVQVYASGSDSIGQFCMEKDGRNYHYLHRLRHWDEVHARIDLAQKEVSQETENRFGVASLSI